MTGSFYIAIVLLSLWAGLSLIAFIFGVVIMVTDDTADIFWGVFGCLGSLILAVIVGLLGLYPYDSTYHSYRPVSGTVSAISSRLVSDGGSDNGGGTSQKYAVTFKGSPQIYGITDTRASLIKVGDHIKIACIRRHQWFGGVDGYDCRWDQ